MAPSLPDVRSLNTVGQSSAGIEAHSGIMSTVDINQAILMGLLTWETKKNNILVTDSHNTWV